MNKMKDLKKLVKAAIKKGRADRIFNQELKDAAAEQRFQAAIAQLPTTVHSAILTASYAVVMELEPEDTIMNGACVLNLDKKHLRGAGAKMFAVCRELDLCPTLSGIDREGKARIVIHGGCFG